jgi:UDP-glucose 4-epimerase
MSGHEGKAATHTVEAMASQSKKSKYLITGRAGFIGSHLTNRLTRIGTVTLYDNLSSGRLELIERHRDISNLRLIKGELPNFDTLKQAVGGHDIVFHLAAEREQA